MRYESHRHRRRGSRNVRRSKFRRVKPDAQIVVYERGGFLSYGACGLPYYVGGFNDDPAKLIARTQAVYKEMRIETHLFHEGHAGRSRKEDRDGSKSGYGRRL